MTAAELLQKREDKPLVPLEEANGKEVRWTFRHPDLDGSGYTGPVHLGRLDRYLAAERGFVETDKPEEREALRAIGWVLWRTEVPDARPIGLSRPL